MLPRYTDKLIVEMTQEEAQHFGLVVCECGHPPNNHFDWDNSPCAHCNCRVYKQVFKNVYEGT